MKATMKQIFLILSIIPFLFGCVQTREQRGAKIAKSEMMKRLYDADSYEPIETQIDSAYTSIYDCNVNTIPQNHRLPFGAIREDGAAMPEKNIGRPKKKWMITLINSKN